MIVGFCNITDRHPQTCMGPIFCVWYTTERTGLEIDLIMTSYRLDDSIMILADRTRYLSWPASSINTLRRVKGIKVDHIDVNIGEHRSRE